MSGIRRFSWAIILCKPSDQPAEPFPPHYFENLFLGRGLGSLDDYWRTMSYGNVDMSSSRVFGWITMSKNLADFKAISAREGKIDQCVVELIQSVGLVAFGNPDGIVAVINVGVGDSGSIGAHHKILLDAGAWPRPTFIAHEMGHCLGLDHTFDTRARPWDAGSDSRPGAYGNSRDIMSAETFGGLPATFDGRFGTSGPGVNGLTRAAQGWLPEDRIGKLVRAPRETWSTEILVAPIDDLAQRWNLLFKVAAAGSYQGQPLSPITYAIEYRPSREWDSGIPRDAVVFHAVYENGPARILWSPADSQDWYADTTLYDGARKLAIDVINFDAGVARLFVQALDNAGPKLISVRKSLGPRYDLSLGLRQIHPTPPFPSNSLRGRLLDNPPQIAAT